MSVVTGTRYAEKEIKQALKGNKKVLDKDQMKYTEEFEKEVQDEIMNVGQMPIEEMKKGFKEVERGLREIER